LRSTSNIFKTASTSARHPYYGSSDNIFFPDTDSSLAANGNGGDEAEKQLQDAMDLLDADEEEVPAEA
jgi:hypothetical protein